MANRIMPAPGVNVCIWVWLNLNRRAMIAGFCYLALGIVYLAAIMRGFKRSAVQRVLP